MFRRFSTNFAILSILVDAGLTLSALKLAVNWLPIVNGSGETIPLSSFWYLIVPPFWATIFIFSAVYDPRHIPRVVDEFQSVTIATCFATLAFAGLLFFIDPAVSRSLFVVFILLDLILLLGWRTLLRLTFNLGSLPPAGRRVLIVGCGEVGQRTGQMIQRYGWTGLQLIGYLDDDPKPQLPILGRVNEAKTVVQTQGIDDVVITLPQQAYGQINDLVLALHNLPVEVRVVPDYFSLALYRAKAEDFGGLPMISLRDPALNHLQRLVKRLFDLTVGSLFLLIVLPFLLLTAIAIRLSSAGPIFYLQQRVGENGRPFTMYKFRTMRPHADQEPMAEHIEAGRPVYKMKDDPRVTPIGRFLRRTSLDELPQLWNVLKGEMSLVGPRPELPWLVEKYEPWQRKRFAVPQGMTGWWQVNGRADRPMYLHTEDDLYYIQNYSIWMDLYILIKTPYVILRGQGAY